MAHTVTRKPTTGHSMQVALTIRKQVGIWAFAEVGARGFLYDENSLYFDCKPKSRIVRVKITLNPSDTYTVRVLNKRTGDTLYEIEDVYADTLSEIILHLAENV